MRNRDIFRQLVQEITNATADIRYYDGGAAVDIVGGIVVVFDDLEVLRKANSAIYRAWLAGCNEPDADKVQRLKRCAARKLSDARAVVSSWGRSPAGFWCEIDARAVADCGALVLVCHSLRGVQHRVDFSYYFGRDAE